MRLHHVGGYTDEERDAYREIVYANLVSHGPGSHLELSSEACYSHTMSSDIVADSLVSRPVIVFRIDLPSRRRCPTN